ncbi:MAG TPA: methionyl-tRNA formyltransferase [Chthoniobacterales bacterium]|nr:methionyl-tRNA formyltransferase [Chthoniobacterales bacterium]
MRVVFIGTGEIAVPTLRALQESKHDLVGIVTQPDRPAGREQKVTAPAIKVALLGSVAADRASPPILQPAKIKDPQTIDAIHALRPDVIVVMAYGQILPRAALEIPRIACLNLHASLLPRWRGAAPIQATIAAGDRDTGITVMFMNEGLDTGDILLQRKVALSPNETGGSLHDRLAPVAADALLESLQMLATGNASRTPQDNSRATLAPKLSREDGRIEWHEAAEVIERKIRAFNPWPTAFTQVGDHTLKIFSAAIVDLRGKPGEILRRERELVIAAKDRALSLVEVQLEGKRRMSAVEFLKGFRVTS